MDSVVLVIILLVLIGLPIVIYFKPQFEIVFGVLVLASLVLYIYGRNWRSLAGFQDAATPSYTDYLRNLLTGQPAGERPKRVDTRGRDSSGNYVLERAEEAARENALLEQEVQQPPFATNPIRSVDDYEYNLVFQNEGERGITKRVRDQLMSQYPMDWSVQPPSSELFQQGLAKYKEAFQNPPPPPAGPSPYRTIEGAAMTPPDTLEAEMKEREILATYTPKDPQSLTTYNAADAQELIKKIYDAKGLVADFKQTGDNQFTIVGTRKKDEPIVYEDEVAAAPAAPADSQANPSVGEGTIIVPAAAQEVQNGLDPFFTAGSKTRDGRWNYAQWTPGLERMFAPSEERTNWY